MEVNGIQSCGCWGAEFAEIFGVASWRNRCAQGDTDVGNHLKNMALKSYPSKKGKFNIHIISQAGLRLLYRIFGYVAAPVRSFPVLSNFCVPERVLRNGGVSTEGTGVCCPNRLRQESLRGTRGKPARGIQTEKC